MTDIAKLYEELRAIIDGGSESFTHEDAVQYLKDKLAQQEQEEYLSKAYRLANELRCHLAIAPAPQRTWVELSEEQKHQLNESLNLQGRFPIIEAIEAMCKGNNT